MTRHKRLLQLRLITIPRNPRTLTLQTLNHKTLHWNADANIWLLYIAWKMVFMLHNIFPWKRWRKNTLEPREDNWEDLKMPEGAAEQNPKGLFHKHRYEKPPDFKICPKSTLPHASICGWLEISYCPTRPFLGTLLNYTMQPMSWTSFYNPVALTSIVIKRFERLVMVHVSQTALICLLPQDISGRHHIP